MFTTGTFLDVLVSQEVTVSRLCLSTLWSASLTMPSKYTPLASNPSAHSGLSMMVSAMIIFPALLAITITTVTSRERTPTCENKLSPVIKSSRNFGAFTSRFGCQIVVQCTSLIRQTCVRTEGIRDS